MEPQTCYISVMVCFGVWCVMFMNHLNEAEYRVTHASTLEGHISGSIMKSFSGKPFVAFKGIPYAKPPVKDLRFKPPQPPDPWPMLREAHEEGPLCPQLLLFTDIYVGNEDCLYMNVYTHPGNSKVPVLVSIHGGAFNGGNGGGYEHGPEYIMDKRIVLVTFNYRIGVFGFLSTGDSVLPGNYGLKDQVEVLRWVQRNIASFGGDPDRVTLQGYSAGGASVSLHLLSPMSKGLFHRAIFQSGSAFNGWAFQDHPRDVANKVAEFVDCPQNSTEMMVECLADEPAERLVRVLYKFPYWGHKAPLPYASVQEFQDATSDDPPFLPGTPEQLLQEGRINSVPVLSGTTSDEYISLALIVHNKVRLLEELERNFVQIMKEHLKLQNFSTQDIERLREFYLGSGSLERITACQLSRLFSDAMFIHGVSRFSKLYAIASKSSVYYYLFTFEGRISFTVTMGLYPEPCGVSHADDLLYSFKNKHLPFPEDIPNESEKGTIQHMTSFIANFANTANPTPENGDPVPVIWKPLNSDGQVRYLNIGDDLVMVEGNVFPDRMEVWDYISEHSTNEIRNKDQDS